MTSVPRLPLLQSLSSLRTISGQDPKPKLSYVSFTTRTSHFQTIRMGGGPRTYPGGVSKWQWKRMQAKKAKQLLKARLARERQIYELRKRAELKSAVSELQRPWEVVEKASAPNLFSVGTDEQLKVLADRFHRPGGFDMWSDSDGPELFRRQDRLPSARFFPKGVVHSIKPYEKIEELNEKFEDLSSESEGEDDLLDEDYGKEGNLNSFLEKSSMDSSKNGNGRKNNYKKRDVKDSAEIGLGNAGRSFRQNDNVKENRRRFNKGKDSNLAVDALNKQEDGSYGIREENRG